MTQHFFNQDMLNNLPLNTHAIEILKTGNDKSHLVIVMVGLPARGKTYIAHKLTRYLNWIGVSTKSFNVGNYRRSTTGEYTSHEFFSFSNSKALAIRNKCALDALEDVKVWLTIDKGDVAVFDATNTTRERRKIITDFCEEHNFIPFFIESICYDKKVIQENIQEVKLSNPDYSNWDTEEIIKDFLNRIIHYEKYYIPLCEDYDKHLSFIKIFDVGQKFVVNEIKNHVQSRIVYYLMNIKPVRKSIYFSRHGESILNMKGKIGGDSDLSQRGLEYAEVLATYINDQQIPDLKIWTSELKRTIQTAEKINGPKMMWKALNEINAGICDEMSYEEIQEQYPEDFIQRDKTKYYYRYPRGESYQDLVARLEPIMMELERQDNVLVITHQATLRCILAYFKNISKEELPYIKVPLHTVFKLTPLAYGCNIESINLKVDAVDTHREKPKVAGFLEAKFKSFTDIKVDM